VGVGVGVGVFLKKRKGNGRRGGKKKRRLVEVWGGIKQPQQDERFEEERGGKNRLTNRSSPAGPALHDEGGSRPRSCSS
jgi:hypothetical protein